MLKYGKLNLVDLAGSESIKRSGAKDERAKEAAMINKSLLTLGRVITSLTASGSSESAASGVGASASEKQHVPYRDSKLTRLLQESLGGKAKTVIIATVSPSADCIEETRSTLNYAFRAKNITNMPQVNHKLTKKALIREYVEEIESLKNQLYAARSKDGFYVPQETWNQCQAEKEEFRKQAESLVANLEARQQEILHWQGLYDNKCLDLEKCASELASVKETLRVTLNTLEVVQQNLRDTEEKLKDEVSVTTALKANEERLASEFTTLVQALDTTTQHISLLHTRSDRQYNLQSCTLKSAQKHGVNVHTQLVDMQAKWDAFEEGHTREQLQFENALKQHLTQQHADISDMRGIFDSLTAALLDMNKVSKAAAAEHFEESQRHQRSLLEEHNSHTSRVSTVLEKHVHTLESLSTALRSQLASQQARIAETTNVLQASVKLSTNRMHEFGARQRDLLAAVQEYSATFTSTHQSSLQNQRDVVSKLQMAQHEQSEAFQREFLARMQAMTEEFRTKQDLLLIESITHLHTEFDSCQHATDKQAQDIMSSIGKATSDLTAFEETQQSECSVLENGLTSMSSTEIESLNTATQLLTQSSNEVAQAIPRTSSLADQTAVSLSILATQAEDAQAAFLSSENDRSTKLDVLCTEQTSAYANVMDTSIQNSSRNADQFDVIVSALHEQVSQQKHAFTDATEALLQDSSTFVSSLTPDIPSGATPKKSLRYRYRRMPRRTLPAAQVIDIARGKHSAPPPSPPQPQQLLEEVSLDGTEPISASVDEMPISTTPVIARNSPVESSPSVPNIPSDKEEGVHTGSDVCKEDTPSAKAPSVNASQTAGRKSASGSVPLASSTASSKIRRPVDIKKQGAAKSNDENGGLSTIVGTKRSATAIAKPSANAANASAAKPYTSKVRKTTASTVPRPFSNITNNC